MSTHYKICGGWGNRISWSLPEQFHKEHTSETRFDVDGHQRNIPKIGDTLEGEFQSGLRQFKFVSVKPCYDPPDMFLAQVKPIPPNNGRASEGK